jgi:hypothetical protein
LPAVLQRWGARPDPVDPDKWHTARGVLSVTGAQFINWNCGHGGGGAIDLVMHLGQLGFGQALQWLEEHGASALPLPTTAPPPKPLSLPPPCPQRWEQVRRYLIQARQLPPSLLEPLHRSGDLYADARANAVFLLRAQDGQPVGAELRGTTSLCWRGMAPGSRKDRGFFALPTASLPAIVLCESAIDAISCHALHPHYRCVSTAGARPHPAWLPELLKPSVYVYCGFDLDDTGQAMARSMIARHPSIQRLRPPRKDWNQALRHQHPTA